MFLQDALHICIACQVFQFRRIAFHVKEEFHRIAISLGKADVFVLRRSHHKTPPNRRCMGNLRDHIIPPWSFRILNYRTKALAPHIGWG